MQGNPFPFLSYCGTLPFNKSKFECSELLYIKELIKNVKKNSLKIIHISIFKIFSKLPQGAANVDSTFTPHWQQNNTMCA